MMENATPLVIEEIDLENDSYLEPEQDSLYESNSAKDRNNNIALAATSHTRHQKPNRKQTLTLREVDDSTGSEIQNCHPPVLTPTNLLPKNFSGLVQCPDCSDIYVSEKALNRHMARVHLKVVKHSCPTCGKVYHYYDGLKRHIQESHSNVKVKYPCSSCGKFLSNKRTLAQHELHVCKIKKKITFMECHYPGCGGRFRSIGSLQKHRRIFHSKSLDEGSSNSKDDMSDHSSILANKFSCSDCEKTFPDEYNRDLHEAWDHLS